MRTDIRNLTEADLDTAARLLAAHHRADRTRAPHLPARFEEPAAVRPLIERTLAQPLARGVAAIHGDQIAGFMIGTVALVAPTLWFTKFLPPRSGQIAYAGHAVAGEDGGEIERQMYAALAPHFIEHGCFTHFVEVSAGDDTALDAWFSLGFGQALTLAERDTSPLPDAAPVVSGVEIHRAGPEEIDGVMELNDHLARHHNASPIFLPYLPETAPHAREHQLELLADPENAHWIAYRNGRPVGMQTFHAPRSAEMARPDKAIYLFQGVTAPGERGGGVGAALLQHSLAWARQAGYERCTLHYLAANIPGARFWQRHGFRPLTHDLVRRIDDRIAWAH
ncbi:MAG: GNAT family N-acetyltransferase [Dehalococcoidia bacterium]